VGFDFKYFFATETHGLTQMLRLWGLRQKTDGGWMTASVFALRATPRQVARMRDDRR